MTDPDAEAVEAVVGPRAPGVGRKRSFDTDEVLFRAMDVFWEHGFEHTTIRQLETALGLKAPSIYNAYGSKSDLLDAVIERYVERIDALVFAPMREAQDPLTGLQTFVAQIASEANGQRPWGCLIVSMLNENAARDDRITARTSQYIETLRRDFSRALHRAFDEGLLDPSVVGEDLPSWVTAQADLLLANVLGIHTAARGRLHSSIVQSMTQALQMQIEQWRSG